jgi:hypothetical protein
VQNASGGKEQRRQPDAAQNQAGTPARVGVLVVDGQRTADDADHAEELEIEPAEKAAFAVLPEAVERRVDEDDVDGQHRDVERLGHGRQDGDGWWLGNGRVWVATCVRSGRVQKMRWHSIRGGEMEDTAEDGFSVGLRWRGCWMGEKMRTTGRT